MFMKYAALIQSN